MANTQENIRYLAGLKIKPGDDVLEVASSATMNAIIGAIVGLARGDTIFRGVNTLMRRTDTSITISALTGGGGGGISASPFTPFLVYPSVDNTDPPYPILKVYPGKIAGIIPTLDGVKLDVADDTDGVHPWFYPPGTNFSFFLRCKITTDPMVLYRSSITEVKAVTDDDPLAIPDVSGDPPFEIPELRVIWDAPPEGMGGSIDDHRFGHFYIRIADIEMKQVEGDIIFVGSSQWLFSSYAGFVIAGDEVVITES